jgi:hypothetical protein
VTAGGIFPLGGFGEAFLPQPQSVNAAANKVAENKTSAGNIPGLIEILFIEVYRGIRGRCIFDPAIFQLL